MTAEDDGTIANDDMAYRRVHPKQAPPDLDGVPRLSSAAFKLTEADHGRLSIYLRSEVESIPATSSDCVAQGAPHTIAELDVSYIRNLAHGVLRDPITSGAVPNICDPAHAVITGFATSRKYTDRQARALREKARWPTS